MFVNRCAKRASIPANNADMQNRGPLQAPSPQPLWRYSRVGWPGPREALRAKRSALHERPQNWLATLSLPHLQPNVITKSRCVRSFFLMPR